MSVKIKENCQVRAGYIEQEINNSFDYTFNQKKASAEAVKIYLLLLSGLLGFAAYVQTKVQEDVYVNVAKNIVKLYQSTLTNAQLQEVLRNISPTYISEQFFNQFPLFTIFGCAFVLVVFFVGWAFIIHVAHATSGMTRAYKHICSMRRLKSQYFEHDIFSKHSIMPVNPKGVKQRASSHFPKIFNIINFSVLGLMYPFLEISTGHAWAFIITATVLSIVLIYYPDSCINFYKLLLHAERINLKTTAKREEELIAKLIKRGKNRLGHKIQVGILVIIYALLYFLIGVLIINSINSKELDMSFLLPALFSLFAIFLIRYNMVICIITEIKKIFDLHLLTLKKRKSCRLGRV